MNFPIHSYPYDYWRFTPEAFRSLLIPFTHSLVDFAGESDFPHTVVGLGFKGSVSESYIEEVRRRLKVWKKNWKNPQGRNWWSVIKPFVPPVLLPIYRKIRAASR
jgi:hypothetical protein